MSRGYIAGLWRNEMEANLCCAAHDSWGRPTYRTPSWAWGVTDGWAGTRSRNLLRDLYTRVRDMQVYTGAKPYGAVSGRFLRLDCLGMFVGRVIDEMDARNTMNSGVRYHHHVPGLFLLVPTFTISS